MFCSTVIPTIGRATLSRAVKSLLEQELPEADFEVIVVNDSGKPLPKAGWQESGRVQVITTNRHERSVARNTGAAVAKGAYLHFLDDDDYLLPGALQSFWDFARTSPADWLYGGSQLVDREGEKLILLQPSLNGNSFVQVMAGEWIPLQASLISAKAFFAVGGFNPHITGPEDIDLCRRIALKGELAGISATVAGIGMGNEGSTTDYDRSAHSSRMAREWILREPGVFPRLRGSATSSYWKGRMVRIYLTSAVWNLQHKHLLAALDRSLSASASLLLAGGHLFSTDFWRALTGPYVSESFLKGFQQANRPVTARTLN